MTQPHDLARALALQLSSEAFAVAETAVLKAAKAVGITPSCAINFTVTDGPTGFEFTFKCSLARDGPALGVASTPQCDAAVQDGQSVSTVLSTAQVPAEAAVAEVPKSRLEEAPTPFLGRRPTMFFDGASSETSEKSSKLVHVPRRVRKSIAVSPQLIDELRPLSAQELQRYFASSLPASRSPEFYITIGDLLMQKNEPLMAEDVMHQGTMHHAENRRMRQLYGHALTQGGSVERAIEVLESLRDELGSAFYEDESGGLLAHCYKNLAKRHADPARHSEYLRKAYEIYRATFEQSAKTSFYAGINTATMALLLGSEAEAKAIAAEVVSICERERMTWGDAVPKDAYWALATLGEASLIMGRTLDAVKYYELAVATSPGDFAKLSSTKRQLALLLEYVDVDDTVLYEAGQRSTPAQRQSSHENAIAAASALRGRRASFQGVDLEGIKAMTSQARLHHRMQHFDRLFNLPRVAIFTSAEMHEGVLPALGAQAVMAAQFDAVLRKVRAKIGYASAFTVADIIFLEAVKRLGGDIYIVLPTPLDVHLEVCAKKFAEAEELTGERVGPFGTDYAAAYSDVPAVAEACKRLLDAPVPENSARFSTDGVLETTAVTSVAGAAPATPTLKAPNLLRRLKAVLSAAARIDISNDLSPETSVTNRHYCSLILNGLAVMRARSLATTVERIYMTPNVLRVGQSVGFHSESGEGADAVDTISSSNEAQLLRLGVQRRRRRSSVGGSTAAQSRTTNAVAALTGSPATKKVEDLLSEISFGRHGRRLSGVVHSSASATRRVSWLGSVGDAALAKARGPLRDVIVSARGGDTMAGDVTLPGTPNVPGSPCSGGDGDAVQRANASVARTTRSGWHSLKHVVGRAWARNALTTKLGDEEDDDDDEDDDDVAAATATTTSAANAIRTLSKDDVGPEAIVDPTAAAVFACVPSAVDQWVLQERSFRVLSMDAVLIRATAEEFGVENGMQIISPKKATPPVLHADLIESPAASHAAAVTTEPVTAVQPEAALLSLPQQGPDSGLDEATRLELATVVTVVSPTLSRPVGSVPSVSPEHTARMDGAARRAAAHRQVIMAILFADVVGYSKMGEMQVLTFVERFLGSVAALLDALPAYGIKGCATKNTWGDGLYMVFSRVPDAGTFALLLSDLVQRVPWHKFGLPKSLAIRISLHAAPVHPIVDPVTQKKDYSGVHTSRAARIEPITPPNCVYCSQAFAAISETLCVTQYACAYVGNVPLAKGYGLQPVFHLRWGNSQNARQLQRILDEASILPTQPSTA